MKHFFELGADGALTGRVSGPFDVGGVLEEREHAFFAVLGEGVKIEELIVSGRGIDFKIAGMDHDAYGRVNRQRDAIDQAMRDANGIYDERTDAETVTGLDLVEFSVVQQAVFF